MLVLCTQYNAPSNDSRPVRCFALGSVSLAGCNYERYSGAVNETIRKLADC